MRSQGAGTGNDRLVERAGELCDAAVATAREVLIVSPWLSYEPIVRLLAALPATASLRVVFRWPATPQDLWVLSRRGLEVLFEASKLRNVTVSFVTQGPLHAKVFVFDRRVAYVGSANFTGGGLGRNLELGLRADGDEAARVAAWVDGLPTVPLDDESWGEIQRRFDTVPEPPSPVEGWEKGFDGTGPADLVAAAFQLCDLRGAGPLNRKGLGRNAWSFEALSRRWRVKAHLSDFDLEHSQFHFEVSRKDRDHARAHRLDGLLYVCCERGRNGELRPSTGTPLLVLVPFSQLFEPNGPMPFKALTGHHKLLAAVHPGGDGWVLRIPNSTGKAPRIPWQAPIDQVGGAPRLFVLGAPDGDAVLTTR